MPKRVFVITYRFAIPALFVIIYLLLPAFTGPAGGSRSLVWAARLMIAGILSLAYLSITYLDQPPSKTAPFTVALWRRFGTFAGDRFICYYDPSAIPVAYYQSGILLSMITSLLIYFASPFIIDYSIAWFRGMALLNFILLLVPYIIYYRTFYDGLFSLN